MFSKILITASKFMFWYRCMVYFFSLFFLPELYFVGPFVFVLLYFACYNYIFLMCGFIQSHPRMNFWYYMNSHYAHFHILMHDCVQSAGYYHIINPNLWKDGCCISLTIVTGSLYITVYRLLHNYLTNEWIQRQVE